MTGTEVAINGLPFWIVTALAVALLTVVQAGAARRYVLAALNLLYLGFVLGPDILAIVIGLLAAFALLQALRRPGWRNWASFVFASALLLLLLFHKSRIIKQEVDSPLTAHLLLAIGFSYVALRGVEVLRLVREGQHAPPGLASFINYLVPFHMLAAGPIQSYDDFARQPAVPEPLTTRHVLEGTERISWGLFKKFVLAYFLQKVFLTDLQSAGIYFVLEVQVLLIWLYLDFSAYSDIAVGIGRLTGIATPENFNKPFTARNLIEFWDRWHISLSMFVRRNLFIPMQLTFMRLGRMPHPLLAATVAIGLSFLIVGMWHGFSAGWLVWGCLHALGLITVRIYGSVLQSRLSRERLAAYRSSIVIQRLATVLTFEYVAFAFVPVFLLKGTF